MAKRKFLTKRAWQRRQARYVRRSPITKLDAKYRKALALAKRGQCARVPRMLMAAARQQVRIMVRSGLDRSTIRRQDALQFKALVICGRQKARR